MSGGSTIRAGFWTAVGLTLFGIFYTFIDQPAARALHNVPLEWRDVAGWLNIIGRPAFWYGAAGAALLSAVLWRKKRWARRLAFPALCMIATALLVLAIKGVLGRYRPDLLFQHGLYGFEFFTLEDAYFSLPSGHAACAGVVAALACRYWPRFAILFWLYAVSIAFSRPLLEAHYISDVLAGLVLGGIMPRIMASILPRLRTIEFEGEALHGI